MTTDKQTTVYVTSMLGCLRYFRIEQLHSVYLHNKNSIPEKPRPVVHGMHWNTIRAIIITTTVGRRWM